MSGASGHADESRTSARIKGMSQSAEKVYEAALELSREDLEDLLDRLELALDVGEAEVSPEEVAESWRETLARRSAEVREGRVELVSGEEVGRQVEAVLARHRKK